MNRDSKNGNPLISTIEKKLSKKIDHNKISNSTYHAFILMIKKVTGDIASYEAFNGALFWDLMDEIKKVSDREVRSNYIYCLCRLFKLVQSMVPEMDLFADADNLDISLLSMGKTKSFLTDDYINRDKTFLYRKNSKGGLGIWTIEFNNPFLAEIYVEWLNEFNVAKMRYDVGVPEMTATFEQSFGEQAEFISSIQSLGGATFRMQIEYYKNRHKDDARTCRLCVKYVIYFYRYIMMNYPEFELNDPIYTKGLFLNKSFTKWLCNDYHIELYNPYAEAPSWERTIFIIKGFDKYSSQYLEEDYIHVDLHNIQNEAYRKMIMGYMLSDPTIVVSSRGGNILVASHLPMLLKLKLDPDNPNQNLFYYTRQEAILIRRGIMEMPMMLASKNNVIGAIRRFLRWAADTNKIVCDNQVFDYLRQIEEPSKYNVRDIPEDHLRLLISTLQEMSTENDTYFLVYVVFLLQISTHFRVGTICSLNTDCIKDSMKPGKYLVRTNVKTSHGERHEYPVLEEIKLLIDAAIDRTELYREQVAGVKALKRKVFLHKGADDRIARLGTNTYRDTVQKACDRAGLPRYHSRNIRDSYMTESVMHIIRSGKSDAALGALTKHLNFSTTNHSYLSLKLDEMLEATHGIIIGDAIECEDNIVDEFPSEVGESRIVENGCGRCSAQNSCEVLIPFNCLACEHFRTTVEHEMYFIKAIERIDLMIKAAKTPHDIEDLTTIKRLHVMYLKAIYMIKEEQTDASS